MQQQRMLIQEKPDEKRNIKQNSDGRQIGKNGAHFTNQSAEKKRYFCDEIDDHIATAGPRGTEIIRYFTCKKFVEMTPKERFQELRRKGYCFQCLFPGASQNTGKHSDGNSREISFAKMYHMTNIQPKSIFWSVMSTEEIQKMSSFF